VLDVVVVWGVVLDLVVVWGVVLDLVVVVVLVVLDCEDEVEVEVEVEVVVDEDDELAEEEDELVELDELGDVVVVVVVVVVVKPGDVVVVVVVEQVIVSETIPGRPRLGMTPGVASTGTVLTTPPASVTDTVHGSAKAIGTAARARTTKIAAASSSTARSLRLNVKLVRPLLPPSPCVSRASKIRCTSCQATLLAGTEVCNFEQDGSGQGHSPARARAREKGRGPASGSGAGAHAWHPWDRPR
jgi:hypothetical protein